MTPFAGMNRVTSAFGYREYQNNGRPVREFHRGIDVVATQRPGEALPESAWSVRELTGGRVLRVASDVSRGIFVDVETAPGTFERYQHMQSLSVRVGQTLKQGDLVGVAGNTGNSTGRHLHFGVYQNGTAEANAVDPSPWLGLPNAQGVYPGNNNTSGGTALPPSTTQYVLTIGPMTTGDRNTITAQAKALGLQVTERAL